MKKKVVKKTARKAKRTKTKNSRKPSRKAAKVSMSIEPRRRHFTHDGLKMHYWEWGDPKEETYVFVHGVRDQGRSWDRFLDCFPFHLSFSQLL